MHANNHEINLDSIDYIVIQVVCAFNAVTAMHTIVTVGNFTAT